MSDPNWSSTVLLLHADGSNGSTAFVDSSSSAKTVTANGNAQISTAQFKFGTGSAVLDGAGDWLEVPDSTDWAFGSGQFTVEGWFRFSAVSATMAFVGQYGSGVAADTSWALWRNGSNIIFRMMDPNTATTDITGTWTPATGTWYHLCVDRDASNVIRLYVNGAVLASLTSTFSIRDVASVLRIGRLSNTYTGWDLNGYVDEVRITKGVARYGGAFTAPSAAFPDAGGGGGSSTLWQVNCGSTVALSGWNNDAAPDPSTLSNLVTSTGGASTAGYYCDVWDISKTDGIGHADLPSDVGTSYLKWYGAGRTLRFTGLDNAKTYTVTLYSTAPGVVSNNWTVAGNTQALARGGKAQWTGLSPASGVLEFVSASSTNGTDVTLSAALINEGGPLQGGGGGGSSRKLRRRLGMRIGGF